MEGAFARVRQASETRVIARLHPTATPFAAIQRERTRRAPSSFLGRYTFTKNKSTNTRSSSASTSFVSLCTGPRDFARFVVGSLFVPELLCFFKVDLLSRFDCTLECVDHWYGKLLVTLLAQKVIRIGRDISPQPTHSRPRRPPSPWREFSFALHQIQQAIEPQRSLQQTFSKWNQIARALAEELRNRLPQLCI